MRVLTASEIDAVSGAGWLQNALASLGSKIGAAVWANSGSALDVELPVVGTISLATMAPDLGKTMGETMGSNIGGQIENTLANLPVIGGMLNKLLGN
ncbi:TPA: hypothetical protein QCG56_000115 [Enterobacter cancerogenus]|uniref:hypothetical protein n=1 Tax=Enterobacter sp. TaxID=42895 RepID=UPI0032F36D22|nr:hypothetical protein [Enterobacter cancerogenus]HDR2163276.1 hypothetical protein [Enterobacter cancerogenus]HDR2265902.1 hypothetical protein [Enterobacter cancerogenus]